MSASPSKWNDPRGPSGVIFRRSEIARSLLSAQHPIWCRILALPGRDAPNPEVCTAGFNGRRRGNSSAEPLGRLPCDHEGGCFEMIGLLALTGGAAFLLWILAVILVISGIV